MFLDELEATFDSVFEKLGSYFRAFELEVFVIDDTETGLEAAKDTERLSNLSVEVEPATFEVDADISFLVLFLFATPTSRRLRSDRLDQRAHRPPCQRRSRIVQ